VQSELAESLKGDYGKKFREALMRLF